ncbi:Phosphoinositide phosphatase [Phytophthora cinnamomi]|uniref:Phosphoinositide phosphatase n=1 Tax=Phytophthora cinnamomi TaxID=4785 RepID=UPI00355A2A15|nr:Phosphoinositide phosphatase [Phytophthora cinnamomi]
MFTWNSYLTRELRSSLSGGAAADLIVPLVLGCYEQRKCSVFGRLVSIVLLARRSRHFAGTRYLKRGVADTGKAANDVETEQIIEDESMGPGKFSSFVQHRGSIPVFWSQETSATLPKPPIVLNRVDPTYTATQKHFADLFSRYGSPIVALNLVKQSEKKEREVIVGNEYMNAVEYLNSFMPPEHRVRYVALDYSRLSGPKQKGLNVLHSLDKVAVWALTQTGFFCSAPKRQINQNGNRRTAQAFYPNPPSEPWDAFTVASNLQRVGEDSEEVSPADPPPSPTITRNSGDWLEQRGILRTNCIDCLDRTNVSQFSVGMRALGQQLYVMGIKNTPLLESRSQLVLVLMKLYSLMGDAISMQYGGSEAHKNVKNSAARENVKHRELLTSIRRYYSNSFTDTAKQDAINIFLGHFVPKEDSPPLWELDSDYYLHNFEVRNGMAACENVRRNLAFHAENKRKAFGEFYGIPPMQLSCCSSSEILDDDSEGSNDSDDDESVQNDDQVSIEDYVLSRGRRKFVGDCSTPTADSVYQQYVLGMQSPQIWESDNESVKMYFEAYMRDNRISPDDARSLRDAQVRAGATFKLQTGPYTGLEQNVKARVLVAKKLKTEPEDRKLFEETLDMKKLVQTGDASVPAESLELYKTFFDEELPNVEIYRPAKSTAPPVSVSVDLTPPVAKRCTSATALSSELAKSIQRLSLVKKNRTRFSGGDLISVGPLFKMDGGKDRDFIVFNEAAAENSFGEVTRNETELSFYSK